ncbi:organoarsenical effux MFS transporter ArsJ [SAR92 clade bacterium H921]|jgi:predicted MFS family arabinose efflux permease|nr:organoarsenical effux MFS transporter ArsJ [SAR92 clade bacterium H921]MDG0971085.1 organoarsenical effux MFS transporter ArsJ [Porticoccaceae bacterium]MDG1306520.1 organoarsenical effux MFS transporter ArsJ [Porticoccaceae bacterium]
MGGAVIQYICVTLSYWAFTLTDGALRMLVLLFFHGLGYSPIEIASLFLLYEFFGMVTNLYGGWLATRLGLTRTLQIGLAVQILSLTILLKDTTALTVTYVMLAQALSGIAKDLSKMSAKSSIKALLPDSAQNSLYRWIALLTGSKNALKGLGFFLGGALLAWFGFHNTIGLLIGLLITVLTLGFFVLETNNGKTSFKTKLRDSLLKSERINRLSLARMFLFCGRDVWFVVALPVFLQSQLAWTHIEVGSLMAAWIIGYGAIQTVAPRITNPDGAVTNGTALFKWANLLLVAPCLMAAGLHYELNPSVAVVVGLVFFAVLFAVNSSLHSYLIVAYAKHDSVSLDVGFYYMANAGGRLLGTILSGLIYQYSGLASCLLMSALMIVASGLVARQLPAPTD